MRLRAFFSCPFANRFPASACRIAGTWILSGGLCVLLAVAGTAPAVAQDNIELRLNQSIEQQAQEREQQVLDKARDIESEADLPKLIVNDQAYAVEGDVNAMGRALYVAIKRGQWTAAVSLLRAYEKPEKADPMLMHYAKGKLARVRGQLAEAEQQFRALLALQADFLPGRLELARVLFERHKNREAARGFEAIDADLSPTLAKTAGVRRTVQLFLRALDSRRSWQGKIAVGPTYDDNLNRSSESYTCLIPALGGGCFISRDVPDAVSSSGVTYEAIAEKHFSLAGQHGAFVRALAYGNTYDDHHDYDENTLTASTGYRYRDADNLYTLGPTYELGFYGNETLYGAWGVGAEWMHEFSGRTALRLEGEYQWLDYRDESYSRYDGGLTSLYATVWHAFPGGWSLFGGLDFVDKHGDVALYAYQQKGIRLGVSKRFDLGLEAILFASLRRTQYDEFNPLLGERRRDDEQNYTLLLKAPRLAFHGIVPTLSYEHTRVDSNVEWLYAYDRNTVSFKFEYQF